MSFGVCTRLLTGSLMRPVLPLFTYNLGVPYRTRLRSISRLHLLLISSEHPLNLYSRWTLPTLIGSAPRIHLEAAVLVWLVSQRSGNTAAEHAWLVWS